MSAATSPNLPAATRSAVCFREQLARIQNRHLFFSLVIAMTLMFSSCIMKTILARIVVPIDQFTSYLNAWIVPSTFDSLMFCALSYHNSYRAMILVWPDRQRNLWMLAGVLSIVEMTLHV
ncbi:hypothetical protein DFJ73DRAFT_851450 [Zopfochytrium polystomum]|nr:hypothetical protein DFJ73DRAFT_851450 [Zopfochytrium polystomum]